MVLKLNRTATEINRTQRNRINENWDKIENFYNNVVRTISETALNEIIDNARLTWQEPVESFSDLTTVYPEAQIGWAAWASETIGGVARAYRFNGSEWVEYQRFIGDAISEVDNRLSAEIKKRLKLIEPTMGTNEIQAILNTGGDIKISSGVYNLNFQTLNDYPYVMQFNVETPIPNCLDVQSNTNLYIDKGATLNCPANNLEWFSVINAHGKSNITITGGNVVGDRNTHTGTTGEWGFGVHIQSCNNVKLEDINSTSHWGDGLTISENSVDIEMINCKGNDNRRLGCSITGVDGLTIDRCEFNNNRGRAPEAGLDIEPEYRFSCRRILVKKTSASNNNTFGFTANLNHYTKTDEYVDIVYRDCYTSGNRAGFFVGNTRDIMKGEIKYINCKASFERANGFQIVDSSDGGITKRYIECTAYNCNQSQYLNYLDGGFASAFAATGGGNGYTGNIYYTDCQCIDTNGYIANTFGYDLRLGPLRNIHFNSRYKQDFTVQERLFYAYSEINTIEKIFIYDQEEKIYPLSGNLLQSGIDLSFLNYTITNSLAPTGLTVNLPVSKPGYKFSFRIENPYNIVIRPQANTRILGLTQANGASITSANVGDFITLVCRNDGNWDIRNIVGNWVAI